ncbi:MAG: preprotein translocase subunit YajC [Planctomycetota bacterium]
MLPTIQLLVLQAEEQTPKSSGGGWGSLLIPAVLVIGIFYFVLILPERKKQKARTAMLAGMKKGDRVMTTSGLYGTVALIQDDVVTLQVADGVRLRFSRAAVQTLLEEEGKAKTAEKADEKTAETAGEKAGGDGKKP